MNTDRNIQRLPRWIFATALVGMTGCSAIAQVPSSHPSKADAGIRPPADQTLLMTVTAQGKQTYICQASPEQPQDFAWKPKAAEAKLFDTHRQVVGQYQSGTTWKMQDGSVMMGQLQAEVKAPEADAIPWMLLRVKAHRGTGRFRSRFSSVNWIQQVNTMGGEAPAGSCHSAHENVEVQVEYVADYYFYGSSMTVATRDK